MFIYPKVIDTKFDQIDGIFFFNNKWEDPILLYIQNAMQPTDNLNLIPKYTMNYQHVGRHTDRRNGYSLFLKVIRQDKKADKGMKTMTGERAMKQEKREEQRIDAKQR